MQCYKSKHATVKCFSVIYRFAKVMTFCNGNKTDFEVRHSYFSTHQKF